jgi:hypothetical protein
MITPARDEFIAIQLLFILQRQCRGYPLVLSVTGQHLFSSDAGPIIRPALASGDGILSLKSWPPPPACINRPPAGKRTYLIYPIPGRVSGINGKTKLLGAGAYPGSTLV